MAKKHSDKVGTFEDFRAPWETEAGSDAEIDKPKLKRFIFNLKAGEAKALDAKDEAVEALAGVEKERDEAKDEAAKASPDESNRKIKRLEDKIAELTAANEKLVSDKEQADLRAEVLEGVDPKIAKYVVGTTQEELEKSLEAVKADFGVTDEGSDDEDDEDEEPTLRTTPKRLSNPLDPKPKAGTDDVDFGAAADKILGGGIFV